MTAYHAPLHICHLKHVIRHAVCTGSAAALGHLPCVPALVPAAAAIISQEPTNLQACASCCVCSGSTLESFSGDVVYAPFAAEIRVLRTLHHRNIITCYEW